jgi:hypothetical protein
MKKVCSVEGCGVQARALGFCVKHYIRNKRYGNSSGGPKAKGSLEERFWRFVEKKSDCECWNWFGQIMPNGYGRVSAGAKLDGGIGAHRVSWSLFNKQNVPHGMYVMHSCDNRACVNPNHLSIGTPKDNTQDMIAKGRKKVVAPLGEGNGKAKLTVEKVKLIKQSNLKSAELARQFGLSENCIRGVRIGRTWSHVVI